MVPASASKINEERVTEDKLNSIQLNLAYVYININIFCEQINNEEVKHCNKCAYEL